MNVVELHDSIADADGLLSSHRNLRCFAAWRSIGSNVFLEFGTPIAKHVIPKTRQAFTVLRGEASVGIHGDNWRLLVQGGMILDSAGVDDVNLARVAEACLDGSVMPTLVLNKEGCLELRFEREVTIVVRRNEYPDEAGDAFDEVTINLPGAALSFNFANGFYSLAGDA